MIIQLEIKKEDVPNYMESSKCPITKALHRAGYENWRDIGVGIENEESIYVARDDNPSYKQLQDKVVGMYEKTIPLESFSYNLEIKD